MNAHHFRRAPLAAHLVGMFALADASVACAATVWTVNSCSNASTGAGNTGTLRYALSNAVSGDTVDMTQLSCSSISLTETGTTAGPLTTPDVVTVLGPGQSKLTITGNGAQRIFLHPGPSIALLPLLVIKDVTLSDGFAAYDFGTHGNGGCIDTDAGVELDRVTLSNCHASASGGAVYASGATLDHANVITNLADLNGAGITAGTVNLISSTVSANKATHNGGGIFGGSVSLTDSTVSDNIAGFGSSGKQGGGMFVTGNLTLTRSTVDHNVAYGGQGGITAYNASPASVTTTIVNSTISGNVATNGVGGVYVNSGLIKVYNSTIAFNHAGLYLAQDAAGMATGNFYGNIDLRFHAALITNNVGGTTPSDFSFQSGGGHSLTLSGAHNLVNASNWVDPVFDHSGCARLGPLHNNGGPTRTHALLSGSQALNVGDNVNALPNDQRGAPYARAVGVPDIGAYEVQAEIIFDADFDDC